MIEMELKMSRPIEQRIADLKARLERTENFRNRLIERQEKTRALLDKLLAEELESKTEQPANEPSNR